MLIRVAGDGAVRLEEPANLKQFKLVVEGDAAGEALKRALGAAGRVEGEHVWVSPDWLRRESGMAADVTWQEGFARMVEFARGKGWVDTTGRDPGACGAGRSYDPPRFSWTG